MSCRSATPTPACCPCLIITKGEKEEHEGRREDYDAETRKRDRSERDRGGARKWQLVDEKRDREEEYSRDEREIKKKKARCPYSPSLYQLELPPIARTAASFIVLACLFCLKKGKSKERVRALSFLPFFLPR